MKRMSKRSPTYLCIRLHESVIWGDCSLGGSCGILQGRRNPTTTPSPFSAVASAWGKLERAKWTCQRNAEV